MAGGLDCRRTITIKTNQFENMLLVGLLKGADIRSTNTIFSITNLQATKIELSLLM